MTEGLKKENVEETKECNCDLCCKCEALKKFLLLVLASFLGTLVALCLFSAVVKPKMPPMPLMRGPVPMMQVEHGKFDHHRDFNPEMRIKKSEIQKEFKGEKFDNQFERAPRKPEKDAFDKD